MIYAKDQWIQMPVRDLYDSQIMMASINAAKDMYEKGLQEMKDFKKEYDNFISPIEKDVEYWNNNTVKPVREAVDYIYSMGADPLKNADARAILSRVMNNIPVAELNKRRQAAATAELYLKNKAELEAKGLYNEDYERAQLGGKTLAEWDTSKDGIWSRTSPSQFLDLETATEPYYKDLKPTEKGTVNGRIVTSIDMKDIQSVADNIVEPFKQTQLGAYNFNKKKAELSVLNPQLTNDELDKLATQELAKDIALSHRGKAIKSTQADPFALEKFKTNEEMRLDDYRTANRIKVKNAGGGGNGNKADKFNYFKIAYNQPGVATQFDPSEMTKAGIGFAGHGVKYTSSTVSSRYDAHKATKAEKAAGQKDKPASTVRMKIGQVDVNTSATNAYRFGTMNMKSGPKLYKPNSKITGATVLGNLTYNKKLNRWFVECQESKEHGNKSFWLEASPTAQGSPSSSGNVSGVEEYDE